VTTTDPGIFRDVARGALAMAERYGFALGGGLAWVTHGLVNRPTEDVDLFADVDGAAGAAADAVRAALVAAGFEVDEHTSDGDLADLFDGFDLDMREFEVHRNGQSLVLSLGRLDRLHSPVVLDVGPVLHVDDLVASKMAALISRREVRDYVDVAAALGRYTLQELLDLARRHDPGLEPEDIDAVGHYLDRLNDDRFARYGLDAAQVANVRAALAVWPRP
jgi:hypothetical protein